VPKKVIKQRPIKRSQPKVRFDMPEFDFQLSKIETQSVPIQAPPQRTAPTQPVQPSKSVYQLGEVDQEPRLIHRVRPIYPYYARRRDISGRVILKFLVDTKGNVTDISVVEAKPKGIFEESAIAAVKKWSFKPGSYEGKAVKTLVTVPITFELSQ
jgi:protein TonB